MNAAQINTTLSTTHTNTPTSQNGPHIRRRLPRLRAGTGSVWGWSLHHQTFSGGLFSPTVGDVFAICSSASPAFAGGWPYMREDYSIDFPVIVPDNFRLDVSFRLDDLAPDENPEWDTIIAIQQDGTRFDLALMVPILDTTAAKHGAVARELCIHSGDVYTVPGSNVKPTGLVCDFGQFYTVTIIVLNGIVTCRDISFTRLGDLGTVYAGFLDYEGVILHYLNGSVRRLELKAL